MTPGKLKEISRELQTQDNRITAGPLFCVMEKERIYGVDDDYTDKWEWCNSGQQCSCEPGQTCDSKSNECRKIGYVERDRFVNAHFTEKAANHHIKINGHNLARPFIYVTSLWRCYEMIDIRNALMNQELKIEENQP